MIDEHDERTDVAAALSWEDGEIEKLRAHLETLNALGRPTDSVCPCKAWPCDCPCHVKQMVCVFDVGDAQCPPETERP